MLISGPVLKSGQWTISGTKLPDGTLVGTTSSGVRIFAGSDNISTGSVVGGFNTVGYITVSGSGAPQNTVIGQTQNGLKIIAGGESAPMEGTIVGTTASGELIVSTGRTVSSTLTQNGYATVFSVVFVSDTTPTTSSIRNSNSNFNSNSYQFQQQQSQPTPLAGNLNNYISSNLMNGVLPSNLYAFTLNWPTQNSAQSNFNCAGNSQLRDEATVVSINPSAGTITLEGSQGNQVVRVGGCTQLRAASKNYKLAIGDRVQWTGYRDASAGIINASTIACNI